MREILFRGKCKETGRWYEGYYIHLHKTTYCFKEDYERNPDNDIHQIVFEKTMDWGLPNQYFRVDVIPETIGQYTGLNDKKGKKIFEGDIVNFGINQRPMYVHWNDETLTWELTDIGVSACEVNHLSNTFDLGEIQVESAYGEMFSEVVGNIYDNIKLL